MYNFPDLSGIFITLLVLAGIGALFAMSSGIWLLWFLVSHLTWVS